MSVTHNAKRSAARINLLATTGLVTLILAALTAHPGVARAQMAVTTGGSVQVNADTTTTPTTNTDGANPSSFDQIQLWDNGTPITASTDGISSISGSGLALVETGGTPASISMTNIAGSDISSDSGVGLQLLGNGGGISYTGGGTVSGNTGITASEIGSGAMTLTFGTAGVVTGAVGDGLDTSAVDGDTLVTVNGVILSTGTGVGINASASGSGNLAVVVASTGAVVSLSSTGVVLNQTGTGSNMITNDGVIVDAGTAADPAIAIATTNSGTSAIINSVTGSIIATGENGLAILSTVTTGADTINNAGFLYGGVYLSNQSNSITNSGSWYAQDGTYNAATFGTSGLNSLTNSGTINADPTSTFTGIETINNSGTINADFSTFATGGTFAQTITNTGTINLNDTTNIDAGGAQSITNSNAINVNGTANFMADGAQTVTNTGTISVNGAANFVGSDGSFTNTGGLIDMRSATTTNVTALNVTVGTGASSNTYTPGGAFNFAGGTNSKLGLDTFVGGVSSAGSDVPSDRLLIGGAVTGTTGILLNDTNALLGSYNPVGITLVAVNGASTDAFYLQSVSNLGSNGIFQPARGPMGAIKEAFWFYPLLQSSHATAVADGLTGADSTEYRLYGLPDVEAFQTTLAITGAEDIWYDTALGWSQRQDELSKHWSAAYGSADIYGSGKFNFWMKATGNRDTRTDSISLDAYAPVPGVLANLDAGFKQDDYSVQAGTDVGFNRILDKDDVLVLGASIGIVDSTLNFKTSGNTFDYSGATAAATIDYLHGGLFWDTSLKGDFLQATLNYNSLAYFGFDQQIVQADTWGVLSSAGYHINLGAPAPGAAFIEPLVIVAYTWSSLGGFPMMGTRVDFDLSRTARGAVGARLGSGLFDRDGMVANVSITGNYWNEFTNDTGATLVPAVPAPALTLNDPRAKDYGEVTGQVNIADKATGWSGFLDGGAKFSRQFTSIELSGGIAYKW